MKIKRKHLHYKQARKGILQQIGFKHHEFWTWWILLIPVWPLWFWYMIRLKNITWFTAVNTGMEDSGFLGESKIKILDSIPSQYIPKTLFIKETDNIEHLNIPIEYPLIAKPDVGGRGRKIKIIHSFQDLKKYHHAVSENYMIQQLIEYPMELGLFYIRMPWLQHGEIVSLCEKEFLTIQGNGKLTIKELMHLNYRSRLQIERLSGILNMNEILAMDEIKIIEPIGNHCRGTLFRDRGNCINQKMSETFDQISKQINGFYYGRFDIRTSNMEDLMQGKNIFILELNGITSDATHIFDPNAKLRDAIKIQIANCKKAFKIAQYNLKHGAKTTDAIELYKKGKKGF